MKKIYKVVIHYEGAVTFEVEAENTTQAERLAEACFDDMSDGELIANLGDIGVCDVYEVAEQRLDAIAAFAQRRDAEIVAKKKQAENREEFLKQTILGWSDRIQQLIDTANACISYGIPICHDYINGRNYDDNYFRTDGCSHILGFEFNPHHPSTITRIGKEGGGYDHYNVYTDGKTITATGDDRLWALERFVEKFDEFETKFYAYVDKVCKSK